MSLVTGGLLGPLLITRGLAGREVLSFRLALRAKLVSLPAVTAVVGNAVHPVAIPPGHSLWDDGPAVTYAVQKYPPSHHPGHNLAGPDGTALVRIKLSAWTVRYSDVDALTAAFYDAFDGLINADWGGVQIMSCIHTYEVDIAHKDPNINTPVYQTDALFDVRYRIAPPART